MDVARKKPRSRKRWIFGTAGVAALALSGVALGRMEPAAPSVERANVWTDTVRRGDMVRQVRGPGTLVAEDIRWVSVVTPGRIERKLVEPGTKVDAGTVIVEISNPDAERQMLEAQRQLAAAVAELATLRSNLENQRLTQEGTVAQVTSDFNEAQRQIRTAEGLAAQNLVSPQELAKARDRASELRTRLDVERRRLQFMGSSLRSQVDAQEKQVTMLRTLAAFQQQQMEAMKVRAGTAGVLQELPVEMGQWVNSGATLAKVVQPGRLKAVLRIPETQAKDLTVGQVAGIDTRNGVVRGHVTRIDPASQNGTVGVDVSLDGPLPQGARPDLSVDGTIDIERLHDVLYVGRPGFGQPESTVGMFRLTPDGRQATRVSVRLGRGSASTVEVAGGLKPGDVVILSDMSQYDSADRVRLQ
ncbi:MAG TPA: HlyD family efflux transporter periplasmic adaptor subunit [Longimicrobiaceae bacterium]|nr:HlyD family efflux transporter periplasmic adaptor subunit [Longimicrobiaceae bacterium]